MSPEPARMGMQTTMPPPRRWRFYVANALVTLATAVGIFLGIAAWNTYQRVNALWAWAPEMEKRIGAVVDGRVQKPLPGALPTPQKGAPK